MRNIISSFIATVIFFLAYFLHITIMERSARQFLMIFLWSYGSSLFAELLSRIYFGDFANWIENFKEIIQDFFSSLIYTIGIFFGILPYLLNKHNIVINSLADIWTVVPTPGFLEFFMYFLIYKLLVYLLADYLSDSVTFESIGAK